MDNMNNANKREFRGGQVAMRQPIKVDLANRRSATSLPLNRHALILPVLAFLVFGICTIAAAQDRSVRKQRRLQPQSREKIDALIGEIREAEAEITISMRRSKLIHMNTDILRAAVADPALIEFVAFGTREIELIGKSTGKTNVTLWLGDPNQPEILSFLVKVEYDRGIDEERRLEYHELEISVNELFPNSKVRLFPVADKLIVKGQARDSEEASRIMSILRGGSGQAGAGGGFGGFGGGGGGFGGFGSVTSQGLATVPFPGASNLPPASVINMLTVPGEQQVLLKVRIAELSRSSLRSLGVDFDAELGGFSFRSFLTGGLGNLFVSGTFEDDSFNLILNALESHGVAKLLAQPNLVTLSGQTATFIAGGQFAVPTVVGVGGAQAATTQFHGFGTQINFTPTVMDKDRIRLQVSPSFSSINSENAVNGIPGLDTRAVSTTVDLREGQVLAIAGLIESSQTGSRVRVPILGRIPLIGWLANDKEVTSSETELVVIVTPELVSPMDPCDVPVLMPGMELTEPSDHDFYCRNRIEGRPDVHHRNAVWPNYRDQLLNPKLYFIDCQQSQGYFLQGPQGLSN